jgi:CheY-like chemotaxis protein
MTKCSVEGWKMQKKALVVDDDDSVRNVLHRLLEAHQYEVEATGNPEKALEIIADRRFDVVFTDYEMPGINGIELTRVVRKKSPHSIVILMTGRPAPDLFRSSGADGFLQKPFSDEALRAALGVAARSHRGEGGPEIPTQG